MLSVPVNVFVSVAAERSVFRYCRFDTLSYVEMSMSTKPVTVGFSNRGRQRIRLPKKALPHTAMESPLLGARSRLADIATVVPTAIGEVGAVKVHPVG